jgi:AcrR family transcriptional regulator
MGRRKRIEDDELLGLAREVFVAEGLRASTKEIARRAGLSEAALFQRYVTKADLFFAAMVPPPADLHALFSRRRKDAFKEIEALALGMLDYFRKAAPTLAHLTTHPDFRFEEFAARHPDNPFVTFRMELGSFLGRLKAEGGIGDADIQGVALSLFASIYGIAQIELLGAHGGRMPDRAVRAMVHTLWRGLAPV